MSEFSTSYHIRIDGGREVQKLLRGAKFAGVTFGPRNGWLTFVPYASSPAYRQDGDPKFAVTLSRLTHSDVLYYLYAEDHGWAFALVNPDRPVVQHACWWNPKSPADRQHIDLTAFDPLIARGTLEPLLDMFDHKAASRVQPAYRFAELLGLPAYKWLSPELVQEHTDDYLEQGGRKLGAKPTDLAARLGLPADRQIAVPYSDFSAREAFGLMQPFIPRFSPPWCWLMLACSAGPIRPDGRAEWDVLWRNRDTGDTVVISLRGDGRLLFRANSSPAGAGHAASDRAELPEHWLDSTDIAAIAAKLTVPNEIVRPQLGLITLRTPGNYGLVWQLSFSVDKAASAPYASWTVYVDAVSGDVEAEWIGRLDGHYIVDARQRVKGGDWEDFRRT